MKLKQNENKSDCKQKCVERELEKCETLPCFKETLHNQDWAMEIEKETY